MKSVCGFCGGYSHGKEPIKHPAWCIERHRDEEPGALYGVRVIVNGRERWAVLPNGAKGYATFEEAQEVANSLARRFPAAFVRRRGK